MHNWSTDTTKFVDDEAREVWELEQSINYGLNGKKIDRQKLVKYFSKLSLDIHRRRFIELLLNADSNPKTN